MRGLGPRIHHLCKNLCEEAGPAGDGDRWTSADSNRPGSALERFIDQHGTTKALMLADGFTDRMLGRRVDAGLITIRHEVIKAGTKPVEVSKVRVRYSGRRALEG
jgi:hypothetical protein